MVYIQPRYLALLGLYLAASTAGSLPKEQSHVIAGRQLPGISGLAPGAAALPAPLNKGTDTTTTPPPQKPNESPETAAKGNGSADATPGAKDTNTQGAKDTTTQGAKDTKTQGVKDTNAQAANDPKTTSEPEKTATSDTDKTKAQPKPASRRREVMRRSPSRNSNRGYSHSFGPGSQRNGSRSQSVNRPSSRIKPSHGKPFRKPVNRNRYQGKKHNTRRW